MADIIERYAFSLLSRLDAATKEVEQSKFKEFQQILRNPNSITDEFRNDVKMFFKRLIIISLCPNQEDTYEDICMHLDDWYQNYTKLDNIYKIEPTKEDLEAGDTSNFLLKPSQRDLILRKWKDKKRKAMETTKKAKEFEAIYRHIKTDTDTLTGSFNQLQKKKFEFKGPSHSIEKRTQYIQTDLIFLIDQLNRKIAMLKSEKAQQNQQ